MHAESQTWAALVVVIVAAAWLLRTAWRHRGSHEGCGCPGATAGRELRALKRRLPR